jgi:hypothetical protein
MPLVVELEQRWAERVVLLQVHVMHLRLASRVSALLTDIHLQQKLIFALKSGQCQVIRRRGVY